MNSAKLIKRAILSEKSYGLMDKGIYTILVAKDANKNQIKKAVENQFQVNVKGVNVLIKSAKTKRITGTRKTATIGAGKKAVITLEKGQSIALFSTKSEKPASQAKRGESKTKKTELKEKSKEIKKEDKGKGILGKFRIQKSKKERE
ncbi:50S ribosomal protein L23 [Candidatus Curtissbacteria bacterium RIFCSPLOWO2_01_FULL_39_62]|uniref:Large ribosomal subunit protein uL23 n=2 Tax=Candidatus Curtissiibacteriota TaxID=1752717 RepID=A0A1F5G7K7_9BACT|nr:MAG: 50S ribosomal protein L23 [Candidatus Curtissbacteria bacterium RIFCSPHIGHO2_01_FULL_39_57]OGD87829.1 MAG: 50S ribosomal protein L23 [Candidatus Curtissbacteria bacterium RIFCSPHIGHO2_02_FULL_40_16b]OGD90582.1 MAG: 50S ribosomal protein L23 [Candidatus Curtissbacteria bacterium RIFCSPHIGHO2_12_FULL_38_37]OGD99801.1 MAG: 50S ribosomal protein L23 [Candidatus Curtissbacteria bacterium RIFCSPLOWO2_02_FULL_40_11]OGE01092.1 MAG: 50S ribosomal protein L23 [Candidatus Curtissbacteria bacterium